MQGVYEKVRAPRVASLDAFPFVYRGPRATFNRRPCRVWAGDERIQDAVILEFATGTLLRASRTNVYARGR